MGKKFKFIADKALPKLQLSVDSSCHSCGSSDIPIYNYRGVIIDPYKTHNPNIAIEEPEVSEVCADCIQSGNIKCSDFYLEELRKNLEDDECQFPEKSIPEISATPQINSIQSSYWPVCCGDFTEYIGDNPIEGSSYEDYISKAPNFIVEKFQLVDFYPLEKLSVWNSMNLFQCNSCSKKYWNFQYSGLMWRGPIEETSEDIKNNEDSLYDLQEEDWSIYNDNGSTDNKKAKRFLKKHVFIENVKTGDIHNIHDLKSKTIVFVTYWDTSSAAAIGHFKKRVDKGEDIDVAFVYFENEKREILELKSDSWFIDFCYVLNVKSKSLKDTIAKVPLVIKPIDKKGIMRRILSYFSKKIR